MMAYKTSARAGFCAMWPDTVGLECDERTPTQRAADRAAKFARKRELELDNARGCRIQLDALMADGMPSDARSLRRVARLAEFFKNYALRDNAYAALDEMRASA